MQLQEIISPGILKSFLQSQLHDLVVSKSKCSDFEKNGIGYIVAQRSATPTRVAATPPCSATPFQRQQGRQVRQGLFWGGCSAIPTLHLKNPRILRKSAATRVVRQGAPHMCARIRARQKSGEGVVRENGRLKGCFWRVRFCSAPVRFALKTPENLGREETDSPKHPFGRPFLRTTPSPLLWRTPKEWYWIRSLDPWMLVHHSIQRVRLGTLTGGARAQTPPSTSIGKKNQ